MKVGKIVLMVIAAVILAATFKFLWDSSRPEAAAYEIISPRRGDIENTTTATGNIEPRNETAVKPDVAGIISEILKEVGETVNEGDVIAILKIIIDVGQLNAAESHLRVAQISLEQLQKDYERQKMLFENDVISRNEYEVSEAAYRKAVEEEENAEDALQIVKNGYARRSDSVNNTEVRARSSGTILDIPVKVGDSVINSNPFNEGTTIAVIANMDDLIFRGTIDETEVGKIQTGMLIKISVGALSDETVEAVLEYIAPKGKKENGSVLYEIKAAVKTPPRTVIRANYSANANIVTDEAKDVIIIPESSIEFDKGLAYIYVLMEDTREQSFIRKQIEIGLSDGINVEVKSGLNLTDRIRGPQIRSQTEK
ncbi:MAG: efflux RND transporter periplasmic adaptor subunit [Candidatus Azobacteroides sp.]|nr:efflux RND transporter periplasmic adaptor subunit [Candidatus Azobacteroides sp.]